MTQTRARSILIVPAALALLFAGCGDEDGTTPTGAGPVGVDDYSAIDFDLPYGGLTKTDEQPAFGDPYLLQMDALADLDDFEDALAQDPEVRRLQSRTGTPGGPDGGERPRFTFLHIAWGVLDGPIDEITGRPEDGDLVDWSGHLSVDRGIVLVRRVILFERPADQVIQPRPDRQTVAWRSHTGLHYDGLIIEIIEPPLGSGGEHGDGQGGDPDEPVPNVLHFVTGPFTRDFPVDELAGLDEVFEVEPAGNAIHFAGFTLGDIAYCPKGFLAGRWVDDPDREEAGGFFAGRWVSLYGLVRGYLRGAYGLNREGEPVFYGKYVGRDGRFQGLVEGVWTPGEDEGEGSFEGHWVGANELVEGVLDGRFLTEPGELRGFFQGRWATLCDEEAVSQIE